MFEVDSLQSFATVIDDLIQNDDGSSQLPVINKVSRQQDLPLSFAQERLWFLHQMDPDTANYNIPSAVRIKGDIDSKALVQALCSLVERHETLRTTFKEIKGEMVQIIHENKDMDCCQLPIEDIAELSGLSDQTYGSNKDADSVLQQLIKHEASQPFDLENGPLFRVRLIEMSDNNHLLLSTMHHIISDGWSSGILVNEVARFYQIYKQNESIDIAPLSIQYADYSSWQRHWFQGDYRQQQLDWWKNKLTGSLELLNLPTDRPRPNMQTFAGDLVEFNIEDALATELTVLCRNQDVTLFMLLLTVFKILLHRYSHQEIINVGSPIAGRNHAELEEIIGCFVNTLVLSTDLSDNPSFTDCLKRVKETALGAFSHQEVPFEQLVELMQPDRNMSHSPLFQVAFTLQTAQQQKLDMGDLEFTQLSETNKTSKFDLTLTFIDSVNGLKGVFEYNTDLFDRSTIVRMTEHCQNIINVIVKMPSEGIQTINLLGDKERDQLLNQWNITERDIDYDRHVPQIIEALAKKVPNLSAIVHNDKVISYAELNAKANQLANHIVALGLSGNKIVGVYMDRSIEMIVSFLAIWKAGGAYVPIDPVYPADRVAYMAEDADLTILLTQQSLMSQTPDFVQHCICVDNFSSNTSTENINHQVTDDSLAYVIYTSGSTGKPKGVMIEQNSLLNLVNWYKHRYQLNVEDRCTHIAGVAFDASVLEIWPTLCSGASLWLVNDELRADPEKLTHWLIEHKINISFMATPLAERVIKMPWPEDAVLRSILTGGDKLHDFPAEDLPFELVNHYGPTECTVLVTLDVVVAQSGLTTPSIGKAMDNTRAYILDSHFNPVPIGVPGELLIAGQGVGRGYLNQPELTEKSFIDNPYDVYYKRMYRTGDLVRFLTDGRIEYLGRIDQQVKIRGYRIELGEIEVILGQYHKIQECVVIAHSEANGQKSLVSYIVPFKDDEIEITDLRQHLLNDLPEYMVPSIFIFLDELPVTANGKLDRKALPEPNSDHYDRNEFVAPRNPLEEQLASIWQAVLSVDRIGIHDNFFDLGGHSLLATQVNSLMRDQLSVEIPLKDLFECPTIAQLAVKVAEFQAEEGESSSIKLVKVERDQHLPLSFAQERMWFIDQLSPNQATYNIPAAIRLRKKHRINHLNHQNQSLNLVLILMILISH